MSTPEAHIRRQLTRYLRGGLSLNEFRLWLMPLLWTIDRDTDSEAFQLASKIALYITEGDAGHRSEADLAVSLRPLGTRAPDRPPKDGAAVPQP